VTSGLVEPLSSYKPSESADHNPQQQQDAEQRHGVSYEPLPLDATQLKPVCVEPRPSTLNMTLPAFAAERSRYWLIDGTRRPQSLLIGPGSATNQPHAAAAVGRRDRRTDVHVTVT